MGKSLVKPYTVKKQMRKQLMHWCHDTRECDQRISPEQDSDLSELADMMLGSDGDAIGVDDCLTG